FCLSYLKCPLLCGVDFSLALDAPEAGTLLSRQLDGQRRNELLAQADDDWECFVTSSAEPSAHFFVQLLRVGSKRLTVEGRSVLRGRRDSFRTNEVFESAGPTPNPVRPLDGNKRPVGVEGGASG